MSTIDELKDLKIEHAYMMNFMSNKLDEKYYPDFYINFGKNYSEDENSSIKFKYFVFSGGEMSLIVDTEKYSIKDKDIHVRAYLDKSSDHMFLLELLDILLVNGANIYLEIPYLPYARQDRYCAPGQSFSLKLFVDSFKTLSSRFKPQLKGMCVWDVHSEVSIKLLEETGFEEIDNLYPFFIISQDSALIHQLNTDYEIVLVCPDKGAINRTNDLKNDIDLARERPIEIIHCDKSRDPATGNIVGMVINEPDIRKINNKKCFIADDICDGGATFVDLSKQLKDYGAKEVILYVTHGIFSKGFEKLRENIDIFYTTNSKKNDNMSREPDITIIGGKRKRNTVIRKIEND